jgi:hypothetical protein
MVQGRDCNNLVKIGQSLIQILTKVNVASNFEKKNPNFFILYNYDSLLHGEYFGKIFKKSSIFRHLRFGTKSSLLLLFSNTYSANVIESRVMFTPDFFFLYLWK